MAENVQKQEQGSFMPVHFPVDKVVTNRLVHRTSRTILSYLARPEQERAPL